MEQIRSDMRKRYIILVQSMVRRFCARRKYLRNQRLALGLQRICRGYLARRRAQEIRWERSAIVIQRCIRGWLCKLKFKRIIRSVVLIQTYGRGLLARKSFTNKMKNYKATVIQRYCRGYLARKAFNEHKKKVIICESAVRRFLARRQYKKLRAEARTITHIQKMYKGLENKIISLQQKIDELAKDNQQLRRETLNIPKLKKQLEASKHYADDFNRQQSIIRQLEIEIKSVHKQLDIERDEKLAILEEKNKDETELKQQLKEMMAETKKWSAENENLKEMAKQIEIVSSQRNRVLQDSDNNEIHQAYQKIAKDKKQLEDENRLLNQEIERLLDILPAQPSNSHSRSASNVSSINVDEDCGYASAKNTLELRRERDKDNNNLVAIPSMSNDKIKPQIDVHNTDPNHSMDMYETFNRCSEASTPKKTEVLTILKLRKILDDEIVKRKSIEKQLKRTQNQLINSNVSSEDSLR